MLEEHFIELQIKDAKGQEITFVMSFLTGAILEMQTPHGLFYLTKENMNDMEGLFWTLAEDR